MFTEREYLLKKISFKVCKKFGYTSADSLDLNIDEEADGFVACLTGYVCSINSSEIIDVEVELPKTVFDYLIASIFKGKIKYKTIKKTIKANVDVGFISNQFNFPLLTNKQIVSLKINQDKSINILNF